MPQPNDLSRSLVALDQNSTIIAVVEMSQSSWLIGGLVPGIERQPRQKLEPSPEQLLAVLHRWRDEAVRAGRTIRRIALASEAGRDGFWLARWLWFWELPNAKGPALGSTLQLQDRLICTPDGLPHLRRVEPHRYLTDFGYLL